MTNQADTRSKFIEEYKGTVDRHRDRAFEYEEKAIDFANSGLRALTYLNGGALIALPTAMALFHTDIQRAQADLVAGGVFFVIGLLAVVLSQGCAFFTMARRAESETHFQHEQTSSLYLRFYPGDELDVAGRNHEITSSHEAGGKKLRKSNEWWVAGICFFILSLFAFLAGGFFSAKAVLPV